LLRHAGQDRAGHTESGVQRNRNLILPLREGGLAQGLTILTIRWPPGLRHARVVHQNVDPSRAREHGIDKSLHVGFDGEIGNERKHSFAASVEFAGTSVDAIGG